MRLAAIDLGTNSFHLVIADTKPSGDFRILASEKEMVRLGESGADMKFLTREAMERGYNALRRFKASLDARGVKSVRAIATSAIREAENQDEFIRRVRVELGITVDVVSGYEEGRLIYLGVLQALPLYTKRALVIDIGGGSTEYVVGERANAKYISSLKIGAIRLTKRFGLADRPDEDDVEEARKYVVGELASTAREVRKRGFDAAAASSGTALSIAAIIAALRKQSIDNLPERLNRFTFSYAEAKDALRRIIAFPSPQERKKFLGVDEKRADIILGGAIILVESMRMLGVKEITISSYAMREGIIYDYLHNRLPQEKRQHHKLRDVREQSVRHLAEQCNYEKVHADKVAELADSIFLQTRRLHGLRADAREYLRYASILHDIGYHISHAEHHQHSYYIISNADLLGFTHEEVEIIANIARYHRKSHPKLKHEGFMRLQTDEHREMVRKLAAILRLAESFDRGNIGIVRSVQCKIGKKTVDFLLKAIRGAHRDLELEIWGAERKKMLFQEVYTREVRLREV
jgi:exopolyphosphatase/guanosine-5'-triphosphate,3'-diphosphate pyrophosphatase